MKWGNAAITASNKPVTKTPPNKDLSKILAIFIVLLSLLRLLTDYQAVASGDNKTFCDNKTVICAVLPDIRCLYWIFCAEFWNYSKAFCRND